ncbi:MAG: O-antigen ligase family protein [Blastocatellia bacterium]
MTAYPVLLFVVGSLLLILWYRFRDNFLRVYGLFFLILLVYASNKEYYGISPDMSEGAASPLSLVRWGLLGIFAWAAWRSRMPARLRGDAALGTMITVLLLVMVVSGFYAPSFSYSFMRAASMVLLALALVKGLGPYLQGSMNCLRFFQLKYYVAWIVLAPMMFMLLSGIGYGVTIIMNQYAGYFGNQNMFGTFSALITPYVLFHWRAVARKRWERWADVSLLLMIFAGLWFSNSRNGAVCSLIAITAYFYIVNTQDRIKIFAVAICIALIFAFSPSLQSDLTRFIRKGTDKSAGVTDISTQFLEEKRYEMWTGVLPMFWKEKLTGYGFASSHLLVFPFTKDEEAGRALHNSYLEIFGDLGLPGLLLLLVILFRIATKAAVLVQNRGEYLERNINAVFISIFIAGSTNAFFESWMFSVGNLTSLIYWGAVTGVVARWAWRSREWRATASDVSLHPQLSYTR